jgi:hypothetical protein
VVLTNSFSSLRLGELAGAMAAQGVLHWECWSVLDSLTPLQRMDSRAVRRISQLLYSRPWSQVVTHGLRGEYGHVQHQLLSRIVHSLVYAPMEEHWARDGPEGSVSTSFEFAYPGDAWKKHVYTQHRPLFRQVPLIGLNLMVHPRIRVFGKCFPLKAAYSCSPPIAIISATPRARLH